MKPSQFCSKFAQGRFSGASLSSLSGGAFGGMDSPSSYADINFALGTIGSATAFARTTAAAQTDFEGRIWAAKVNEARFEGLRRVENLASGLTTQTITVVSGSLYLVTISGNAGATCVCSGAFTGTITAAGTTARNTFLYGAPRTATSASLTLTVTGTLTELLVEDVTGIGRLTYGSELWDNNYSSGIGGWLAYATNTVVNDGGAIKITYVSDSNGAQCYLRGSADTSADLVVGKSYALELDVFVNSGSSVNVALQLGVPYTLIAIVAASTTPVRYRYVFVAEHATDHFIRLGGIGSGEIAWIKNISLREVSCAPSEYVSAGVLSSPYHGAFVDGVKYFAYQCGNTVDAAGVVTAGVGAAISGGYLLLEPQATNLAFPSNVEVASGKWAVGTDPAGLTSILNAAVGPDGTFGATKIQTKSGASAQHTTAKSFTGATSTNYTFSLYTKNAGYDYSAVQLQGTGFGAAYYTVIYRHSTGAFTIPDNAPSAYGAIIVGNMQRIFSAASSDADGGAYTALIGSYPSASTASYAGDGTSGSYVWRAQVETGLFPTSPIQTTTAAATRTADSAITYPSTLLPSDQSAMTVVLDGITSPTHNTDVNYTILRGESGKSLLAKSNGSAKFYSYEGVATGEVTPSGGSSSTEWNNVPARVALRCGGGTKQLGVRVAGVWRWGTPVAYSGSFGDGAIVNNSTSHYRRTQRLRVYDRTLTTSQIEALP